MVLGGYFDESEREEALDPICVGGYLFTAGGYQRFRKRWRHALKLGSHKFPYFHMTDLYAGRGIYDGVSIPDRQLLLSHAVEAITNHAYGGVAVHFDKDEFEGIAPIGWEQVYGSIYSLACQMAMQATSVWLKRDKRCHLRVLYVFERGHKFQHESDAMLRAIADNQREAQVPLVRQPYFREEGKGIRASGCGRAGVERDQAACWPWLQAQHRAVGAVDDQAESDRSAFMRRAVPDGSSALAVL